MSVVQLFHSAKASSAALARANTKLKNSALEQIAFELEGNISLILAANALDLTNAQQNGVSVGLQDRLKLDEKRIAALAAALRLVVNLPDPIGQNIDGMTLPNGLKLQQIRVPVGVVGVIYEARPNVTVDISPLWAAPDINGTNNRLVKTYSNEKLTAVKNSKGPALLASSKKDLGTDKYHTRSNQWLELCIPLKYLL